MEGTMSASILTDRRFELSEGEKLGNEITELCSHIYAATHHLLALIREFDENRYWAELGFEDRKARRLDNIPVANGVELEESLAWMYRKYEDKEITAVTCWRRDLERLLCRRKQALG